MGFINGVKTVFSDLKQYINQIDCPDEENVITDPELLESLQSIEKREKWRVDKIGRHRTWL